MRYLAIDYGRKRTGLAVCDAAETLAAPLAVLTVRQGHLVSEILEIIKREAIEAAVLGLPLNMDGSEGAQAKLIRQFARELQKHTDIPIHFHDERLTSFEAEKKLSAVDLTRKKKKKWLDAVAAAAILQSFLDAKHTN